MPDQQPEPEPTVWAVVSLMGHKQYAGRLSEAERFGGKLGRVDVIDGDGFRTVEFNAGSVYSIEYVSEEAARVAARRASPRPVESWELPKPMPLVPAGTGAGPQPEVCGDCAHAAHIDCDNYRCANHCDEKCNDNCDRHRAYADKAPL